MANLGYIGLAAMGGRIADRLLSKGHTVIGHNRTKSKAQWLLDEDCAVLFHVLAKLSGVPA